MDLARRFKRFCRLLVNLPIESRFMKKYIPSKDWDFDKETQSRILLMLDVISCQLSNMFKKKGIKPRKPDEQFQPDYVKEAKKEAKKQKKEVRKVPSSLTSDACATKKRSSVSAAR